MKFDQQNLSIMYTSLGLVKVYYVAVVSLARACFYHEDNITISRTYSRHTQPVDPYYDVCIATILVNTII